MTSLTIAVSSTLVAALLPYLFVLLTTLPSKTTPFRWGQGYDNDNPRASLERLEGWRKRAHHAQQNGYEAFPPFAAGMILAHLASVPAGHMLSLAAVFIGARLAHGAFYVAGRGFWRSTSWFIGAGAVVALYISALIV